MNRRIFPAKWSSLLVILRVSVVATVWVLLGNTFWWDLIRDSSGYKNKLRSLRVSSSNYLQGRGWSYCLNIRLQQRCSQIRLHSLKVFLHHMYGYQHRCLVSQLTVLQSRLCLLGKHGGGQCVQHGLISLHLDCIWGLTPSFQESSLKVKRTSLTMSICLRQRSVGRQGSQRRGVLK